MLALNFEPVGGASEKDENRVSHSSTAVGAYAVLESHADWHLAGCGASLTCTRHHTLPTDTCVFLSSRIYQRARKNAQ